MTERREIAKIVRTSLGIEDHGILSCWLNLEYGTGGQGAGGYAIYQYDEHEGRRVGRRVGHRVCGDFILGVLRACGVEKWEDIKGRTVYAVRDGDDFMGRVIGLEPLPTEPGKRFMFDEVFAGVER